MVLYYKTYRNRIKKGGVNIMIYYIVSILKF